MRDTDETPEPDFGKRELARRPDLMMVHPEASRPIPPELRAGMAREHVAQANRRSFAAFVACLVGGSLLLGAIGGAALCHYLGGAIPAFDRKADAHLLSELVECAAGPAWSEAYRRSMVQPGAPVQP